jgi:hypothetical protein
MARAKAQEGSISGWFRKLYRDEPKWLSIRSNAEVIQRWEAEHPGQKFGKKEQQGLANVKSAEKKRQGIRKRRGRKAAVAVGAAPQVTATKPRTGVGDLEDLEVAIDRCLSRARHYEEREEGMHAVVRHLRAARNDLVLLGK